jgi:hypothetical protein
MKQEEITEKRHANAACFIYNGDERGKKQSSSIFAKDQVVKDTKPEVIPFPFSETTKTVEKQPTEKQTKARSHRAAFTVVSAIFHMKYMADRQRAQKLKEMAMPLEKDLRRLSLQLGDKCNNEVSNDDAWDYLKHCRYLRGVEEDKELTCEEIFE